MSERGSFVTEYIYCRKCLAIAKKVLIGNHKHLKSIVIPSLQEGQELPIIAGRIGGTYAGEELITMEHDLISKLEVGGICHQLRVAVLADNGEHDIFTAFPEKEV